MSYLFVGRVWTGNPDVPEAEAVAVRNDKVVAIGSEAACANEVRAARRIEAPEGLVIPGFHDAHTHIVSHGVRLLRLGLDRTRTVDEVLSSVIERAKMTPADGWIVGYGWDESRFPDRRMPTRAELDRAGGGRPVLLHRVDMHMAVASTAAMRLAGVYREDGVLREEESQACDAAAKPAPATLAKGIERAVRDSWRLGITSVHAIVSADDLRALVAARQAGSLGVRVGCYIRDADAVAFERPDARPAPDAVLRLLGTKLFADGSIGAKTAAVRAGYEGDAAQRGRLLYTEDELASRVRWAKRVGLQPAVHAIGDAAIHAAITAYQKAGFARADRPRIEHVELADDEAIRAMADRGIVASMQPNFVGQWGHAEELYAQRLGKDIIERHNRFRTIVDAGVPLAFGSDHMPYGPLYGIHHAVNGPSPAQRITVEEALSAYTKGAAFAGFGEETSGMLAVGRPADCVVLGRDPRERPSDIESIPICVTMVGGRIVYES
ncbi:MAG: amidohydrolase [Thermoplasmatota archaeon]